MDQRLALNLMKAGNNVFFTWQAWSGKTYVLNQFIERAKEQWLPLALTASTGIAATHVWWTTIHAWSWLGIKESLSDEDIDTIMSKIFVVQAIKKAKILIVDEISMLSATTFDNVDKICQAVRRDGRPFGWLHCVVVGDFFQLPPVGSYREWRARFACESRAWGTAHFTICYLTEQQRQKDSTFIDLLQF